MGLVQELYKKQVDNSKLTLCILMYSSFWLDTMNLA